MLNALSLTASCDAASTTKSNEFEESRCAFSTISGFCFNFVTKVSAFQLSESNMCVSCAGVIPVSIAIAI